MLLSRLCRMANETTGLSRVEPYSQTAASEPRNSATFHSALKCVASGSRRSIWTHDPRRIGPDRCPRIERRQKPIVMSRLVVFVLQSNMIYFGILVDSHCNPKRFILRSLPRFDAICEHQHMKKVLALGLAQTRCRWHTSFNNDVRNERVGPTASVAGSHDDNVT